jgi:predicted nucleic acid-binding protein
MPDPAQSRGLVLDTSVWINLLATGAMEAILGALAVPCHTPEQVLAEIRRHPVDGAAFSAERHPLRAMAPMVSILELESQEMDLFFGIVGAQAVDALGDGEAAAIAAAVMRQLDLVIDDRKARRILRERFSQVATYWTVDLLRSGPVIATLGSAQAGDCFDKARRFGRMHVPPS